MLTTGPRHSFVSGSTEKLDRWITWISNFTTGLHFVATERTVGNSLYISGGPKQQDPKKRAPS